MLKWIFGQKIKYDRGMQIVGLTNFCLLILTNTEKIQRVIPLSSWAIVILSIPTMIMLVWFLGWLLLRVGIQQAEEDAMSNFSPSRQEIRKTLANTEKILNLLTEKKQNGNLSEQSSLR